MDRILTDKVAIVTGAGSGIGRGSAEILARHGASVLVADRDCASARSTAETIGMAGGEAHAMTVDVADDAQLETLVAAAVEHHGGLDILLPSHPDVIIDMDPAAGRIVVRPLTYYGE